MHYYRWTTQLTGRPTVSRSAHPPITPPTCAVSLQPVPGLRLPRSKEAWAEAQAFFLEYPPLLAVLNDLDRCAADFQCNIYDYFQTTFGLHRPKSPETAAIGNSALLGIRKQLRSLKAAGAPADNIERASHSVVPSKRKRKYSI